MNLVKKIWIKFLQLCITLGLKKTDDEDDDDDDDESFLWYSWLTKAVYFISSRDHCQRSSPSWISDTHQGGFEPAQNMGAGLVKRG